MKTIRVRVHVDTRERLERLAADVGLSLGELARELISAHVHGVDRLQAAYETRIAFVVGPEIGGPV